MVVIKGTKTHFQPRLYSILFHFKPNRLSKDVLIAASVFKGENEFISLFRNSPSMICRGCAKDYFLYFFRNSPWRPSHHSLD